MPFNLTMLQILLPLKLSAFLNQGTFSDRIEEK